MIGLALFLIAQSATGHADALAKYKKHAYAEAVPAFRKAMESEKPGSPEYQESVLLLGQSLYLSGNTVEAVPYLEKASPSDEVLYMLGTAYVRARDANKANAIFSRMYAVEAGSAASHLITAQMMLRQDLVDEAEKELQAALERNPKLPQVHYMLGEISMTRSAADSAIAYLKQEVTLNPNWAMAYYKLGDAYTRRSDWNTATGYLQKSIWLNPDFSGPYILLGKCYLKLGQPENAEGVLRHAVSVDPHNYSAHYLLGQTLMQQGRNQEAREILELAKTLKP